jgi:hypothetical protein
LYIRREISIAFGWDQVATLILTICPGQCRMYILKKMKYIYEILLHLIKLQKCTYCHRQNICDCQDNLYHILLRSETEKNMWDTRWDMSYIYVTDDECLRTKYYYSSWLTNLSTFFSFNISISKWYIYIGLSIFEMTNKNVPIVYLSTLICLIQSSLQFHLENTKHKVLHFRGGKYGKA